MSLHLGFMQETNDAVACDCYGIQLGLGDRQKKVHHMNHDKCGQSFYYIIYLTALRKALLVGGLWMPR